MKRNKSLNRKKAISLIVLVITIIIIVIIATTGVILVANSGIFHSSTELTFKNDMSQYSDRIKNYFGSKVSDGNENIRISGENLVEYIPELKDSKYLDKLYVLDGELVIDGSKITEDEKNWAKEIGIHVSDSLEIIGLDVVTTENTIEIKSINTSGDLTKGVKYKFKLDDNEKESTTSSYTFGKLESGKYYLVNVSIVSSEGQELASYKKNIKTRINNDVVDIKLSTENWTKGPIKVTLEYENIPQAYKIQYKIGKEEFKDYTKEFEVTENNTFIYARLYNKDVGRDTSNNYVEIKNIDKEVPLKPTAISTTSGINSIKVRASGSQDSLSGILGYKYSLDGITYTSTIKAYDDYTFTNINADTIKTIYTKAVDNVGNESEVYSKDWSTWEASEKVKISIDPAEDLWTNKAVTVSLSHQSIPTNYIMQYRINNGSWADGYTAKVTENRTKIEARLYNKNLNDEIGLNSLTIGNIDRIAPNVISAEFNPTKNTIEVSNIVAKDEGGSGIANYELSIKKHSDIYYTPYTSEQNKYTFEGLVKDTLYDIHIRVYDKAGNVSDYYSKSIPTVCTITLDSQGADSGKEGTKTIYEKYEKGFYDTEDCTNKITSISIPQKTGFVFDGYYTEKNGKGTKMIDGTGNITSNLKNSYYTSAGTLYANWVAKKITVIFMRNTTANDTTSDTQEFTYGVTGQSFSAKGWTKKGYTLLGWHEDKNSTAKRYNITSGVTNAWIESKYNASSNHTVTLYAIWQPNTYTVKYNGNGATGGTTANSSHTYDIDKKLTKNGYTRAYTVTYNHNYTGSTNSTKTATYSFVNWNAAANGTGTKYANEATVKNLTDKNNDTFNLYAIWKSASLTYVPTRTGYVFDGWFEDAECTKRTTNSNGVYTPTANKTLYAHWVEKQIKVIFVRNMPETNPVGATFDSNYKDDYSSDATNQTFTYGVSGQKFSAKGWSHPQYDIIAWSESRTATSGYPVLSGVSNAWIETKYNASSNHTVTLYAIWQPKVFTIRLNNISADRTAGTTEVYEKFNKGRYLDSACTTDLTSNKITIPEKTGHTFKGYYTEQNGKGTKIIDENGNVTSAFTNRYFKANSALYAYYTPNQYNISFDENYLSKDVYGTKSIDLSSWTNIKVSDEKKLVDNLNAKYGKEIQIKMTADSTTGGVHCQPPSRLTVGNKYTWSVYVKTSSPKTLNIGHEQNGIVKKNVTTEWQRITYTFTAGNTTYNSFILYLNGSTWSTGDVLYIHSLELAETDGLQVTTSKMTYTNTLGTLPTPTREGYTLDGFYTSTTGGQKISSSTSVPPADTTYYARWKTNQYTVKYDYSTNGGTSATATEKKVYFGNNVDLTPTANKDGWEFVGWNTNKDAQSGLTSLAITNAQNITLYAIYKNTVTATCNYYNGLVTTSSGTMYNNATSVSVKLPKIEKITPSTVTYNPRGWSESPNSDATIDAASEASVSLSSNKTYYASYSAKISVDIYYCGGDGTNQPSGNKVSSTSVSGTRYVNYKRGVKESTITIPLVVKNSKGYCGTEYSGVSKEKNSTTAATLNTSNTTYYAFYTKSVTLYYYDGSKHTASGVRRIVTTDGTNYISKEGSTIPTPSSYDGAAFKGWSYTNDAVNARAFNATAVDVLYAYYQKTITVSYNKNGGTGTIASVSDTKTYISKAVSTNASTAITTIKPTIKVSSGSGFTKTGYVFSGWNTKADETGTDYTKSTAYTFSNNLTLYAKWQIVTYSITYVPNGGTLSGEKKSYNVNTTSFTLVKPTRKGYTFTGWTGTGLTTATKDVTISKGSTGNRSYTANWALTNYTITYTLNAGQFNSQPTTNYNITSNTVTLLTPTREGYTFTGWTGSNGTTKQKTVTIPKGSTGNKTYTANWTANEYKVTLNSNGGEKYLYEGTTFDVTYGSKYVNLGYFISGLPPTKKGYVFAGWYTAKSGGTNITASSTVSTAKNHTLYAHWTEKHILITYYSNGATQVGSAENAGLSSDKTKSTITTTITWTNRNRHKNSDGTYGEGVNLWNCTSLFSRPGYHTPSNAKAWLYNSADSKTYINQASQNFTDYFGDGVETKIKLYANWEKHKYGAYETSPTEHWKTCSVCKAVVSGKHSLSGSACGSTDLIIPKNSYSGTKDSFGRFIYDAKCKKCGGNVDYHSSYDLGKPSTDISKKFSTYKGTDGKTYGYANCPKKKCSTCGGWFDP